MKPPVQTSGSDYKVSKMNFNMVRVPDDSFVKYFYGIKFSQEDSKQLNLYFSTIEFRQNGLTNKQISENLKVPKSTIEKWVQKKNVPFIIRLYSSYQELEKPKNKCKWLSINTTRGGLLVGPWVQVPTKIHSFEDIKFVLDQLMPLDETYDLTKIFGLKNRDLITLKYSCFYYLLGMLLGDGAMCKGNSRRFVTRRITLNMTKRHKTNKKICQYTEMCCNLIGLRMKRTKDDKPSRKNKHYFYRWQGQCSQLVNWISKVCFGLEKDEVKTYTLIKSDWIIKSPKELQISFLQGVADSDGYIDIGTKQVGIISKSSITLIEKILDNIGIHNCRKYLDNGNLATTMINFNDAYSLPIFNPHILSYRFKLLRKMNNAEKLSHHLPKRLDQEVTETLKNGATSIDVVKLLLFKHNLCVRESSIQKRIRRLKKLGEIDDFVSCF